MAAAEEEARQKVLKELKEKNDMIVNIKERKNEGPVLKYYVIPKYMPNAAEFDKEGYLPLHWACEAQAKNTIVDVVLAAYPEAAKTLTKPVGGEGGGDLPLHLACMKPVTGDTAKALAMRIESMGHMITSMIKAYPAACSMKQRGVVPLHLACTYQAPIGAVQAHIAQYADGCKVPADGTGNLPLHLACLKGSSEEVIMLLVSTYPEACKVGTPSLARGPSLAHGPSHALARPRCPACRRRRRDRLRRQSWRRQSWRCCDCRLGAPRTAASRSPRRSALPLASLALIPGRRPGRRPWPSPWPSPSRSPSPPP